MKCKCSKCGYVWLSRIEQKPKACPKCKRYNWDEDNLKEKEMKGETKQ